MKKYPALFSFLLSASLSFISSITYPQIYDSVYSKEISPGVIHKRVVSVKDTIVANIIKVDLKKGGYYLKAVKADNSRLGRKKTSEITSMQSDSGYNVIAAVNADFFNMKTGEVENNMITDGRFLKAVSVTQSTFDKFNNIHSQFAFTYDNTPLIDRFLFKGELTLQGNKTFRISGINCSPDSNSIVVYNSYQGSRTPEVPESWKILEYEIVPLKTDSDTMLFIASKNLDQKGNNPVNSGRLILSANNLTAGQLSDKVHDNDTLKLIMKLLPERYKIRTLVGGWPAIVRNGRNIANDADFIEGTFSKFSKVKHPRTGIGFDEYGNTLYLITVDGRQESSSGVSLEVFADMMLKEGIYQGLNFDGGGSTTMVVNGSIVNHPSDKEGERPVGNCLLLIGDKTTLSGGVK